MSDDTLPNSLYIDIILGLKYLNNNKKLYLKILNSFLTRYKDFDVYNIKDDELKSAMHTLKGLTSTLGMEELSNLSKKLHDEPNEQLLSNFSEVLRFIINDLNTSQIKNLLIIDSNSDRIDGLIDMLEDHYDIMVATTSTDAIESINSEKIHLILLHKDLENTVLIHRLEQKSIRIIKFSQIIDINKLILLIKNS